MTFMTGGEPIVLASRQALDPHEPESGKSLDKKSG
jgi:hypothetical protein